MHAASAGARCKKPMVGLLRALGGLAGEVGGRRYNEYGFLAGLAIVNRNRRGWRIAAPPVGTDICRCN